MPFIPDEPSTGRFVPDERRVAEPALPKAETPFAPAIEAGKTLASGTLGTIAGGFAGMAGAMLPGPEGQGRDWAAQLQDALTIQPKTAEGVGLTNAIALPFQKLAEGADVVGGKVADVTKSPALGAGVNTAIQVGVPTALMKGASMLKVKPVPEAVKTARDAGIAVTPSEGSGGFMSKLLESLSGEPRLAKKLSVQNQPAVQDLIAKDIGIPGTELSRNSIYENIDNAGKTYEVVRRSGRIMADKQYGADLKAVAKDYEIAAKDFPEDASPIMKLVESANQPSFDANSAMSKIKILRKDAKTAFARQDSELGRATIDIANALEDQVARHLEKRAAIDPSLAPAMDDFRQGRTTIAKSYAALKALNDTTGEINPQVYAKMLDKNVPLSGEARTVAEMAKTFPRSLQNPAGKKSTGATIFDAAMAVSSKHSTLLGARPIARSILASGPYQDAMALPGGNLARLQANPGIAISEMSAEQRNKLSDLQR